MPKTITAVASVVKIGCIRFSHETSMKVKLTVRKVANEKYQITHILRKVKKFLYWPRS